MNILMDGEGDVVLAVVKGIAVIVIVIVIVYICSTVWRRSYSEP